MTKYERTPATLTPIVRFSIAIGPLSSGKSFKTAPDHKAMNTKENWPALPQPGAFVFSDSWFQLSFYSWYTMDMVPCNLGFLKCNYRDL